MTKITASEVTVKDRGFTNADFLRLHEESMDPNLHYRWARVDATSTSINRHKLRGYEPVKKGDVSTLVETEAKGGENIIIGDLMLMACAKDEFEQRQRERAERTDALIKSTTIEAERRAAEKGIKLIADADHRKETRT